MRRRRFPWQESPSRLQALLDGGPLELDPRGRAFVRPAGMDRAGACFEPPGLLPVTAETPHPAAWLARYRDGPGRHAVVLLRAGAFACGLWEGDELVSHRCSRRYVVRGRGKAQPTYLASKGKSRAGSRLRLRNARALLEELGALLRDWGVGGGDVAALHYAAPVRLWSDFLRARTTPPLDRQTCHRLPWHVSRPDFRTLLDVRRRLGLGAVTAPEADGGAEDAGDLSPA